MKCLGPSLLKADFSLEPGKHLFLLGASDQPHNTELAGMVLGKEPDARASSCVAPLTQSTQMGISVETGSSPVGTGMGQGQEVTA